MAKRDEIRIVHRGQQRVIAYAVRKDGSRPAEEFIEGLDEATQARLLALLRKMGADGRITNDQKFKKERGEIWGFKPTQQVRIPCFQDGRYWFLTHGFTKKRGKWPVKELDRADQIRDEHFERYGKSGPETSDDTGGKA